MSDLKEVPQAKSLVNLPVAESSTNRCPVILRKGKRTGEQCGEPCWGKLVCSAHDAADKRKYGSSNPFLKAMHEATSEDKKPFTIIGEENDSEEDEEDLPPQPQPPQLQPQPELHPDDIEEITISLKNVKAVCFKIVRQR